MTRRVYVITFRAAVLAAFAGLCLTWSLGGGAPWPLGGGVSYAAEPVNISGPVTDTNNTLRSERQRVEAAVRKYADASGYQLFVVYVDDFGGLAGAEWADQSAARSNLSSSDLLLAIATRERSYGLSVGDDQPLSDKEIEQVDRERLLPKLRDSQWADAAIATAEGLTEASQGSGIPWGWVAVGGAAAAGVGLTAAARRLGRAQAANGGEDGQSPDSLADLTRDELDQRRGSDLVEADNSIKASEQELAFAEAQFGKQATQQFAEAIASARLLMQQAFDIQQRLDDDVPESDSQYRQMSGECIALAEQVDETLQAHVNSFNDLRAMQERAPEVLADVAGRADEVAARLPSARAQLEVLATRYPATALLSVAENVDQAEALIGQVKDQCAQGQAAAQAADRATAVVRAKAAEAALGQAATLLNAIDSADTDLAAADGKIDERVAAITADLADGARLAPNDEATTGLVAQARGALAAASKPDRDPLATLTALQTIEAKLDDALNPLRKAAAEQERKREALAGAIGSLEVRMTALNQYIDTRRGAVGQAARTRLAQASRLLTEAQRQQQSNPAAALQACEQAGAALDGAEKEARADVTRFEGAAAGPTVTSLILSGIFDTPGSGGGFSSGWGGGGGRQRSRSSSGRRSSSRRQGGRSRGGRF